MRNDDDLLCFIMCLHVMTSAVDIYIYMKLLMTVSASQALPKVQAPHVHQPSGGHLGFPPPLGHRFPRAFHSLSEQGK